MEEGPPIRQAHLSAIQKYRLARLTRHLVARDLAIDGLGIRRQKDGLWTMDPDEEKWRRASKYYRSEFYQFGLSHRMQSPDRRLERTIRRRLLIHDGSIAKTVEQDLYWGMDTIRATGTLGFDRLKVSIVTGQVIRASFEPEKPTIRNIDIYKIVPDGSKQFFNTHTDLPNLLNGSSLSRGLEH